MSYFPWILKYFYCFFKQVDAQYCLISYSSPRAVIEKRRTHGIWEFSSSHKKWLTILALSLQLMCYFSSLRERFEALIRTSPRIQRNKWKFWKEWLDSWKPSPVDLRKYLNGNELRKTNVSLKSSLDWILWHFIWVGFKCLYLAVICDCFQNAQIMTKTF